MTKTFRVEECTTDATKYSAAVDWVNFIICEDGVQTDEVNFEKDELSAQICLVLPQLVLTEVECPGVGELISPHFLHTYPCGWGKDRLFEIIIHLNDAHKWSRERQADWLEALDVDLSFPVNESVG